MVLTIVVVSLKIRGNEQMEKRTTEIDVEIKKKLKKIKNKKRN